MLCHYLYVIIFRCVSSGSLGLHVVTPSSGCICSSSHLRVFMGIGGLEVAGHLPGKGVSVVGYYIIIFLRAHTNYSYEFKGRVCKTLD